MSSLKKLWQLKQTPAAEQLAQLGGFPALTAKLLANRGVKSRAEAEAFFNPSYQNLPDPFLFKDMERVVERIERAIKNQEPIVVHGDYDADGVCGAAILFSTLKKLGAVVEVFLPHREMDGYGLNLDTVELLATDGVKLVITCDCGISNTKEVTAANSRGLEVIITDHHSIPAELPPAFAIIHPKTPGETYPDQTLCGAGVAFKLAQALIKKLYSNRPEYKGAPCLQGAPLSTDWLTFEKKLLDLVAVASVADMVPLLGETRSLVKFGLMVINKAPRPGLKELLTAAKSKKIGSDELAWKIIPRLNAAGRMNHANSAYQLLLTEDPTEAAGLSEQLETINTNRQKSTEIMMKEARAMVVSLGLTSRSVIVVYKASWTPGLVGLLASRLKDQFGKPALVFSCEGAKMVGSGRSVAGWNMIAALQQIPHFFAKFGGHPQACGFSLKSPAVFDEFYDAIDKIARQNFSLQNLGGEAGLEIEAELPLSGINWPLYEELQKFEPFGQGNPAPRWLAKGVTVMACRTVGNGAKHLKLLVAQDGTRQPAIGFGLGAWAKELTPGSKIDLVYEIEDNEWQGQRELQIKIVDLRLGT